jgi:hypothetical protein
VDSLCLDPAENLFKRFIAAGIHLDALARCFFHDPMGKVLYGVEETGT